MRGNEGCVVVYEKLTLPETMLKKLTLSEAVLFLLRHR